jgi:magnesium transporter
MPIVASMGGIGTTQTATVVVRGLALGDMSAAHLGRVLRKETTLALTIGLANGLVMATIAYLWKGQALLLKSFRVDPAIALSVIVTTFTDVFWHRRLRVLLLPRPGHPPDPIPALVRAAKVRFTLAACKKRVAIFMPMGCKGF